MQEVDFNDEAWYNTKEEYSSKEYIVEYCSTTIYGNSIDIRMYKDIYYEVEEVY